MVSSCPSTHTLAAQHWDLCSPRRRNHRQQENNACPSEPWNLCSLKRKITSETQQKIAEKLGIPNHVRWPVSLCLLYSPYQETVWFLCTTCLKLCICCRSLYMITPPYCYRASISSFRDEWRLQEIRCFA